MRVGFITQWFPPEPAAGIAAAIADGLACRGHDVDVVTGFPNYPTGKLHADYPLRIYRREQRSERVVIHRAPLYPSHDRNALKRVANYTSFAASASWIVRSRITAPDAWLVYSSPATAAVPALLAPRRLSAPCYLIIQDLWPDSVSESGLAKPAIGRYLSRGLSSYCEWSYRRSSGIGIISPGMRRILIDRGVEPAKIHLTPNWTPTDHSAPPDHVTDELRRTMGLASGRLFMYTGNLGELQGLAPLIEAFARCPDVQLALVGEGVSKPALQGLARSLGGTNIHFIAGQPAEEIGMYITASDVQIVSLKDSAMLRATIPSKLQTTMGAGKPILAHAAGDVADIVTGCGGGLAATPGDVAGTTSVIRRLAALSHDALILMGRRARSHYLAHFTAEAGLNRLEYLLASGGPRTSGTQRRANTIPSDGGNPR